MFPFMSITRLKDLLWLLLAFDASFLQFLFVEVCTNDLGIGFLSYIRLAIVECLAIDLTSLH